MDGPEHSQANHGSADGLGPLLAPNRAAEFEVKWSGYAEADNTWEPYANLIRYGSGSKATFKEFFDGIDNQRLRQLLYGGTGVRRREK